MSVKIKYEFEAHAGYYDFHRELQNLLDKHRIHPHTTKVFSGEDLKAVVKKQNRRKYFAIKAKFVAMNRRRKNK